MTLKAFPKINQLGSKYVLTIFDEDVEITEKVDGSQFVFGVVDGELHIRSKGAEIIVDNPEKMFAQGVDVVRGLDLPDNTIFYGEYLKGPKHNVLKYKDIPQSHIALFGASDPLRESMVASYAQLEKWAARFNVGVVPLLYSGKASAEKALELLEIESYLGGPKVEGVVIKNYKECMVADQVYPLMAAKFVSEKFKEIHAKNWKKDNTSSGKWEAFKEGHRTEARWNKAVQHLKENGVLVGEPKDIGGLIKEVQRDIMEEEVETIKQFLFREFGKDLLRRSVAGLPEWYKLQLATGVEDAQG